MMVGLVIDSLPFLLGGSLLSVLIHEFVPAKALVRIFNRSSWAGVLLASLSGIFLPLCECGIVPVVKTLIHRGVRPAVAAVVFFALPLINPVVVFSTFAAFPNRPEIAWGRLLMGWGCVLILGFLFILFEKKLFPRQEPELDHEHEESSQETPCEDGCCDHHGHSSSHRVTWGHRLIHMGEHTLEEVYSTGRYLIVGIVLASFLQVIFAKPPLGTAGGVLIEPLILMALAFILSLCSSTDAFVARGMQGLFGPGSLVSFLLMGPLLHLRNLILVKSVFPWKTVLFMIIAVVVLVFISGLAMNLLRFSWVKT